MGVDQPNVDAWLLGHVLERLADVPARSVHAIVSSPPYWGLRDYDLEPQDWPEVTFAPMPGLPPITVPAQRVSLGLEADPWAFVGHLVAVFRAARRALRPDGTLWLNMGDSHAAGAGERTYGRSKTFKGPALEGAPGFVRQPVNRPRHVPGGLKRKDMVGVPWRVAFALQADGWRLRLDVVWSKPSPMPESVTDRPTKSHELVFLFSRARHYFYDHHAIAEPVSGGARPRGKGTPPKTAAAPAGVRANPSFSDAVRELVAVRNVRSVWTVASEPFPEAHFAVMPTALAERCVLASTSARGVCHVCGAPFRRVVARPPRPGVGARAVPVNERDGLTSQPGIERTGMSHNAYDRWLRENPPRTVGWRAGCDCDDVAEPVPARVLDPFGGAGTTALVSRRLGRVFTHIDASPDYLEIAQRRLDGEVAQLGLFP